MPHLDGGKGDDTISAEGNLAASVLLGRNGDDRLLGGLGRDLLIGGDGRDSLSGNLGSDILIGGSTRYDDDHAALEAIMAEWTREDDGKDPKHAKLKPGKKYRLMPGQAGIYQDGAIHSIDYPDYARFVRVTGTNLDRIDRIRVDLKTGEVEKMYAQRAT